MRMVLVGTIYCMIAHCCPAVSHRSSEIGPRCRIEAFRVQYCTRQRARSDNTTGRVPSSIPSEGPPRRGCERPATPHKIDQPVREKEIGLSLAHPPPVARRPYPQLWPPRWRTTSRDVEAPRDKNRWACTHPALPLRPATPGWEGASRDPTCDDDGSPTSSIRDARQSVASMGAYTAARASPLPRGGVVLDVRAPARQWFSCQLASLSPEAVLGSSSRSVEGRLSWEATTREPAGRGSASSTGDCQSWDRYPLAAKGRIFPSHRSPPLTVRPLGALGGHNGTRSAAAWAPSGVRGAWRLRGTAAVCCNSERGAAAPRLVTTSPSPPPRRWLERL